jgi:tripartite-type tricarboxylate transporter receptor subunit TctC
MLRRLFAAFLFAGLAAIAVQAPAQAQDYPSKPIKIIVAYGPGAGVDTEARALGKYLEAQMKQPVLIENRPGGGTIIGTEAAARSAPDGYTLFFTTGSLATMPVLYKSLPFDPVKDFEPISIVTSFASTLVTNKQVGAKTMAEFTAWAKANKGKVNYASTGKGVIMMGIEAYKAEAGIEITEVPYKGGQGDYVKALLANEVQLIMAAYSGVKQFVERGDLHVLGAISERRYPQAPEIATMQEQGLKTVTASSWNGILAPAGTPKAIVDKLAAAIADYVKTPELQERAQKTIFLPVGSTPAAFKAIIERDVGLWRNVARTINLQAD